MGVTQLLDRTNYLSTLSHLRRVQSPLSRSQPNFEARDLHATHFGRICPSETPEGVNCGLVKNLALSAIISVSVPSQEVEEKLWELGAKQIRETQTRSSRSNGCRIFMDGRFLGYVDDGERLAKAFRKLRREGQINPSASVLYVSPVNDKAYPRLYISLSSGRVLRPLIVVENGRSLLDPELIEKVDSGQMSWRDLVEQGVIELIDANEEENCLVAMGPEDVTHQEHAHGTLPCCDVRHRRFYHPVS